MNTVVDSDVLMIGHVSRDRLVVNGHAASFTGGAVHYGSIPLRCIGLKTAVVTRLHSASHRKPIIRYFITMLCGEGCQFRMDRIAFVGNMRRKDSRIFG